MSYILDALRKAERERNLGQAPSLHAVVQPSALRQEPRRSPWPLVAAAALLLMVAMAVVAWRYHRAANVPAPVAEPPITAPVAALPAPPQGETVSSFDDLAASDPAPAVEEEPATEMVAAAPTPAPARTLAPPAVAEPAVEEEEPVEEPAAEAEVPLVRDMPPAWRNSFPQLTIEVHVYDEDPARRWIMNSGQRYREGMSLAQGPRIVEITPDGIVFEHQGQQALLPVVR